MARKVNIEGVLKPYGCLVPYCVWKVVRPRKSTRGKSGAQSKPVSLVFSENDHGLSIGTLDTALQRVMWMSEGRAHTFTYLQFWMMRLKSAMKISRVM